MLFLPKYDRNNLKMEIILIRGDSNFSYCVSHYRGAVK